MAETHARVQTGRAAYTKLIGRVYAHMAGPAGNCGIYASHDELDPILLVIDMMQHFSFSMEVALLRYRKISTIPGARSDRFSQSQGGIRTTLLDESDRATANISY